MKECLEGNLFILISFSYGYAKSSIRSIENEKQLPRYISVKRAHILHFARCKYNSMQIECAPIYESMVYKLLQQSVGKYTQVRRAAQGALSLALRCFPSLK